MGHVGQHAVVLGGSMGGLLAARVLAGHFDRVSIVERDAFPPEGEHRKGTPQARHAHGLLASAFRPDEDTCVLRSYLRQRATLVRYAGQHIQHMQKALEQMNLKLPEVVSDITGVTGLAILKALLAGERDPLRLARHRDRQIGRAHV